MDLQGEYSRLIELAAQMARGRSMPDIEALALPASATRKLRQNLSAQEYQAHEQCRLWAIELRKIADAMSAHMPPNAK